MPTVSAHVSEELYAKIRENADLYFRGKVSTYLADLLEQEILKQEKNFSMTPDERKEIDDLKAQIARLLTLEKTVQEMQETYGKKPPKKKNRPT